MPPPASALLKQLPPLQTAVLQQLVGQGLAGVYFTCLGQYDRHQASPYFTDPKVALALGSFQESLAQVEQRIGRRNLTRPLYEVLLPSRRPQSINI